MTDTCKGSPSSIPSRPFPGIRIEYFLKDLLISLKLRTPPHAQSSYTGSTAHHPSCIRFFVCRAHLQQVFSFILPAPQVYTAVIDKTSFLNLLFFFFKEVCLWHKVVPLIYVSVWGRVSLSSLSCLDLYFWGCCRRWNHIASETYLRVILTSVRALSLRLVNKAIIAHQWKMQFYFFCVGREGGGVSFRNKTDADSQTMDSAPFTSYPNSRHGYEHEYSA